MLGQILYKLLLGHDVSYLRAYFAVHTDTKMITGCFKHVIIVAFLQNAAIEYSSESLCVCVHPCVCVFVCVFAR